jgi:hypothetical protein
VIIENINYFTIPAILLNIKGEYLKMNYVFKLSFLTLRKLYPNLIMEIMKILKNTHRFFTAIIIGLTFLHLSSCDQSSQRCNKSLFVGSWREAQHGDNFFDEKYAILLALNKDNTFSLSIPWGRTSITGTWAVTDIDTTTILALKNSIEINNANDYNNFHQTNPRDDYHRYYFYRVNKAEKGKIYLLDITTTNAYEGSIEHLFKPQE